MQAGSHQQKSGKENREMTRGGGGTSEVFAAKRKGSESSGDYFNSFPCHDT